MKNKIDPIYHTRTASRTASSPKLEGYLEFRNVTFGYSSLSPPLIEKLSFLIKPGERLALVGPSGCGKSTIAKLAAGLFKPWEGEILYDGKPLEEVSPELFYHSIGHVDQELFLFSGTIRENISLWNKTVTEEMIIKAAEESAIHDEIMQRDKGYENLLTEGGKNLSGGQRQRLEIARAILYSPSLLIMDEATSALDSETEKEISDNMRRKGCSMLMIAHRLSTIQDCNTILVLERGKVVQRGTHQELKSQQGLYRQLIESEA
jgi:ABC-type bacteriocin/lantibiotic exporter with double-glycine peptidase domain